MFFFFFKFSMHFVWSSFLDHFHDSSAFFHLKIAFVLHMKKELPQSIIICLGG